MPKSLEEILADLPETQRAIIETQAKKLRKVISKPKK
jgi:hypothetical protein